MAKAVGTRQIIIPHLGSPSASFKTAGGNGIHEELARNLAEQLKSEDRGDGNDLTPRSRASWASQVEEEHEATGWTGLPRPGKEGSKGAVPSSEKPDDAATKSKKKKNKKKSKGASTVEDLRSPASVGQKSEDRRRPQSAAVEGRVVDANAIQSQFLVSSLKVEGSNLVESVDKKGRNGEGSGSPAGRIKGSNAVWALKRSDSGSRSLPGSSWQPVGVKNVSIGNDGGDSGWNSPSPAVKPTGGWGSPPRVDVVQDSGWSVTTGGDTVDVANASTTHSSNGNWDEPVGNVGSTWDSGWEVAGSRRGNKGEDLSSKLPADQKAKGGQGSQVNSSADYVQRGAKQRSHEWGKGSKGVRSPRHGFQEKGGRPSPRNQPGPSNFGTARQHPTQSTWGKSLNKSTSSNSSNWDTTSVQCGNSANGGNSATSSSILGNLLPQGRPAPESNPVTQTFNSSSISLDAWKGGFPAFSGNASSVCDDYPASLYSDSQCSDEDLDSDTMSLASLDSEDSHISHSTQRMNKWFRNFFQDLDLLAEEQLHEHDRQWHCPACQGGVGAIDWYRGLQPLLAHAKTVRSKRVKLHKAFAEVLEEEIRIRGAAPGTHGSGKYGKWRGLGDEIESKLVVWPPMVVVHNTQLEQDQDEKWIGMGNKELLDLFKKHNPVKARHAYGPQGHRGISIMIFADSPTGYYNAQRLEMQFIEARRGKDNWDAFGKLLFQPGGDRILYGYMAMADDLELFNKHSKGKQNLKWELKSFQDMVLSPMRKLDEDNNKVTILQGKVQREQETRRILTKTVSQISKKLELREEELKVVRDRAKEQHQQQQIEMEDMEVLYKQKIEQLKQEILEKEIALEKVHEEYEQEHMEECEKLQQQASKIPKDKNLSDEQQQQQTLVAKEIARHSQLVEMCIKNQEQWEARKVELLREHHQKMMEFKARQWEDLIKFEQKLDQEREEVMEAFNPTKINTLSPDSSKS